MKIDTPIGRNGFAVVINSTAATYHWGCYATSMSIYHRLIEAGYATSSFSVRNTHAGLPKLSKLSDPSSYISQLMAMNFGLYTEIENSDIVVINGEGTLHDLGDGAKSLLALIYYVKRHFNKKVLLINSSLFPNGHSTTPSPFPDDFYRECLNAADVIVVRDALSFQVATRLGLNPIQGFDCLPDFVNRFTCLQKQSRKRVTLGSASFWTEAHCIAFCRALQNAPALAGHEFVFLRGGYRKGPAEDAMHSSVMTRVLPDLNVVFAKSLDEWLGIIASSSLIVTGRFHHLVAAAVLQIPVASFGGNTLKNTACCQMLRLPAPLSIEDDRLPELLAERVSAPAAVSDATKEMIIQLASNNFRFSEDLMDS